MIHAMKRSVSRKFLLAVMATSFSSLVFAGAALLWYDLQNFQTTWVNDLNTQSAILAKISVPAIEFNDVKIARENLEQLRARPTIHAGAIYAPNGTLFAKYASDKFAAFQFPATPGAAGYHISNGFIRTFKPIMRDGEHYGTVFLEAQYPLATRVQRYLSVFGTVMVASLLFAAFISTWFQSAVTKPIGALTRAVNQVIRNRDFSSRVTKTTEDEIGTLVDAFNSMLAEVGSRANALEASNQAIQHEMKERQALVQKLKELNDTLEDRIAARTADLQRAHEQLRQSQKLEAVGQLTGGVAHDFNNVLQVITANLQLLQMSLAGNPQAQRRLESAAYAADRGAKLSSQLLAFARRQPLQPLPTNLARILRGMDDLLRRALGESIHIETVVAGGLWTTLIDPNQLENVILNLAINARDAMSGEGKLTLELANSMLDDQYVASEQDVPAGQYVLMAISDTGAGMTPEVMARAFEPFFTTKAEGQGTGLGLSMVYGFVKQSHGHIRIYSEVGSGTTIRIYLPRSHQHETEIHEPLTGPAVGGTETILVVEDDQNVQATAVDVLTGLGYRVLRANDAQSALTILQSGIPVDMLFTDVVMPGPVRSPELARQAKQMFPDITVLFTSGYTQNAIVHGGRLDPGVELISKPYRREELARKIRHMLTNKQTGTNLAEMSRAGAGRSLKSTVSFNILVVEDNEDSQKMLCELLLILGHQVQGVSTAQAAVDAFGAGKFDVLLTDVGLPDISGVDLARALLQDKPDLKVIFSSGYGVIRSDDFKATVASLPKPYDLSKLQQVLLEIASSEQ